MVLRNLVTAQSCLKGVLAGSVLQCHPSLQHYPVWCFLNNQSKRWGSKGKQLVLGRGKKPLQNNKNQTKPKSLCHAVILKVKTKMHFTKVYPSESEMVTLKHIILLSLKRKWNSQIQTVIYFKSRWFCKCQFFSTGYREGLNPTGSFHTLK